MGPAQPLNRFRRARKVRFGGTAAPAPCRIHWAPSVRPASHRPHHPTPGLPDSGVARGRPGLRWNQTSSGFIREHSREEACPPLNLAPEFRAGAAAGMGGRQRTCVYKELGCASWWRPVEPSTLSSDPGTARALEPGHTARVASSVPTPGPGRGSGRPALLAGAPGRAPPLAPVPGSAPRDRSPRGRVEDPRRGPTCGERSSRLPTRRVAGGAGGWRGGGVPARPLLIARGGATSPALGRPGAGCREKQSVCPLPKTLRFRNKISRTKKQTNNQPGGSEAWLVFASKWRLAKKERELLPSPPSPAKRESSFAHPPRPSASPINQASH